MQNQLKILLPVSILGISLLLLLSNILEPKLIAINKINENMLDQNVKIEGTIEKVQNKGSFEIFSLKDSTKSIDVLCECNLTLKNNLTVIGKVQEYKNNLQIQAEKIIKK